MSTSEATGSAAACLFAILPATAIGRQASNPGDYDTATSLLPSPPILPALDRFDSTMDEEAALAYALAMSMSAGVEATEAAEEAEATEAAKVGGESKEGGDDTTGASGAGDGGESKEGSAVEAVSDVVVAEAVITATEEELTSELEALCEDADQTLNLNDPVWLSSCIELFREQVRREREEGTFILCALCVVCGVLCVVCYCACTILT